MSSLLNNRIRLAVADQQAILVDIASQADEIASTPENYINCNHLSNQGNRIVGDMFFQIVQPTQ